MTIRVNEVWISDDEIHREMQYHPAPSREQAERKAARALLVRQILLSEAVRTGILSGDAVSPEAVEAAVAELIEQNVDVEDPGEAESRAFYDRIGNRLRSPDLFEASHILFLAPQDDVSLRVRARTAAFEVLEFLESDPSRFEDLARAHSDCSSAGSGGSLGQLSPGDSVAEFEAALSELSPGEIRKTPVETRFGFHIVRLDRRAPGRPLTFEAAKGRVREYLREARWRERFHGYVRKLASTMEIEGFDLKDSDRHVGA
jgi:peptidyl-prolyl cis-trans isomerase C